MSEDGERHLSAAPDAAASSNASTYIDDDDSNDRRYMLDAALHLVEVAGVCVVPAHHVRPDGSCSCGRVPRCKSVGKHPRGDDWHKRANADRTLVTAMWTRNPFANVAIATGVRSGVVVLDIDGELGEVTLTALELEHGRLPATVEAITGRGEHHRHLYFAAGAEPIQSTAGARGRGLGKGLDLRCENGCVIAPPSMHESGRRYAWLAGHELGAHELAPLPVWIREHLAKPRRIEAPRADPVSHVGLVDRTTAWARAAVERECKALRAASEGGRNDQLNTSSFNLGQLVAGGALGTSVAREALLAAALDVGLGEAEAVRTIASGMRGAAKDPRSHPQGEDTHTRRHERGDETGSHSVEPPAEDELPPERATVSDASARPPKGMQPRYDTSRLFAELPTQRWTVSGLQIGPGRPMLIAGYGASAKTLSVQSLALAKASGTPIWGRFDCSPGVVVHVDYEQGFYATAKRYQRLALGHGIERAELGERLQLVDLPRVFLDQKGALDEYLRACDGADLVIIDALRGSCPNTDENDSSFRSGLDVLTFVSQRTGAAFIVLHHAGKPKDKRGDAVDVRTLARGSSAIYDASGCVLNFVARNGGVARHVTQVKQPAEAEGVGVEPFDLVVEDMPIDGVATAGLRAVWRASVPVDVASEDIAAYERDSERVLAAVRRRPGGTSNVILARCGIAKQRALAVLSALADEGLVGVELGPRKAKLYRVAGHS